MQLNGTNKVWFGLGARKQKDCISSLVQFPPSNLSTATVSFYIDFIIAFLFFFGLIAVGSFNFECIFLYLDNKKMWEVGFFPAVTEDLNIHLL